MGNLLMSAGMSVPRCVSVHRAPAHPMKRAARKVPRVRRPLNAMRFESHFKSYFGNVKAFNLKKIKIIAEPVAAMAAGGPAAGGRRQASSLGRA